MPDWGRNWGGNWGPSVDITPTPPPTTPPAVSTLLQSSGGIVDERGGFQRARTGYNPRFRRAWKELEREERERLQLIARRVAPAPVRYEPLTEAERADLIAEIVAPEREAVAARAADDLASRRASERAAEEARRESIRTRFLAAHAEMMAQDDEEAIEAVLLLL